VIQLPKVRECSSPDPLGASIPSSVSSFFVLTPAFLLGLRCTSQSKSRTCPLARARFFFPEFFLRRFHIRWSGRPFFPPAPQLQKLSLSLQDPRGWCRSIEQPEQQVVSAPLVLRCFVFELWISPLLRFPGPDLRPSFESLVGVLCPFFFFTFNFSAPPLEGPGLLVENRLSDLPFFPRFVKYGIGFLRSIVFFFTHP